jgi:uncharacterized damage-inducible protein DinB
LEISQHFYAAYKEARTRLEATLNLIQKEDLGKKLHPSPNSIGFLVRHIADVELLFAKNVFKASEIQVRAKTLIDQKDTGEWSDLKELTDYLNISCNSILTAISNQQAEKWGENVTTKEFGAKTKAEAFGRIISHTAYHAGQIALIKKYGE